MVSSTWIKAVLAFTTLVASSPVPENISSKSELDGYTFGEAQWQIVVQPGQPAMNFTGTIQKVTAEILKINPNFEFLEPTAEELVESDISQRSPGQTIEKREGTICGHMGFGANINAIREGISYLRRVPGSPTIPAGPRFCSRVSCSYDSAIYWCNDNPWPFTFVGYHDIANRAQTVFDACQFVYPKYGTIVDGQHFDIFNTNVFIRGESSVGLSC